MDTLWHTSTPQWSTKCKTNSSLLLPSESWPLHLVDFWSLLFSLLSFFPFFCSRIRANLKPESVTRVCARTFLRCPSDADFLLFHWFLRPWRRWNCSILFFFYPDILLPQRPRWSLWDHCHDEKLRRCQSDAFQIRLNGGTKFHGIFHNLIHDHDLLTSSVLIDQPNNL